MINEKKLDALARVMAITVMEVLKNNIYRKEEKEIARDIWLNGILVKENEDATN